MIAAGIGFRSGATVSSIKEALWYTGCADFTILASVISKTESAQLISLADELKLTLQPISTDILAQQETLTNSMIVREQFGVGSIAEAAALAAAGKNARLIVPRVKSKDGMATAAIAIGETK